MNSPLLKTMLKLVLTGLAVYLVFHKVDVGQLGRIAQSIEWYWLVPAIALFVLSKVLTAFRLNLYFRDVGLYVSERLNIKLYAVGMFYNLFLPGGIGGDGYKVYLLNKHFKTPVKGLLQAVLLDRIGGLVAIVFLLFVLVLPVNLTLPFDSAFPWEWPIAAGILLIFPVFRLAQKLFFHKFLPSFWRANSYSVLGQISQLGCAWMILCSLDVTDGILAYQLVFLLSSIVAVLPLTIGGIGARELVFIYAHTYVGIDEATAVAFSLIFFLISAGVSLVGSGVSVNFDKSS